MEQSKLESFIEATLNIASGFIISYYMWLWFVEPIYASYHIGAFTITSIFTITSFIRSYVWRRFFATKTHILVRNTLLRYRLF